MKSSTNMQRTPTASSHTLASLDGSCSAYFQPLRNPGDRISRTAVAPCTRLDRLVSSAGDLNEPQAVIWGIKVHLFQPHMLTKSINSFPKDPSMMTSLGQAALAPSGVVDLHVRRNHKKPIELILRSITGGFKVPMFAGTGTTPSAANPFW